MNDQEKIDDSDVMRLSKRSRLVVYVSVGVVVIVLVITLAAILFATQFTSRSVVSTVSNLSSLEPSTDAESEWRQLYVPEPMVAPISIDGDAVLYDHHNKFAMRYPGDWNYKISGSAKMEYTKTLSTTGGGLSVWLMLPFEDRGDRLNDLEDNFIVFYANRPYGRQLPYSFISREDKKYGLYTWDIADYIGEKYDNFDVSGRKAILATIGDAHLGYDKVYHFEAFFDIENEEIVRSVLENILDNFVLLEDAQLIIQ